MTVRFSTEQFGSSGRACSTLDMRAEETAPRSATVQVAAGQPSGGTNLAPSEVFVPERYEPNYAYPLIVWLSPAEAASDELQKRMRRLSERNYFGLAVACDAEDAPDSHVFEAVARVRRRWHLHTERIYLAGQGTHAAAALRRGLAHPEWFAGVIALSPVFERLPRLLDRFDDLRHKRVFVSHSSGDAAAVADGANRLQRLLWTAGLSVCGRRGEGQEPVDAGLLRALNEWLISSLEQPEISA